MMSAAQHQQVALRYAAQQAWTAFWCACMRSAGGTSLLAFDREAIDKTLDAEPDPEPKPKPKSRRGETPTGVFYFREAILDQLDLYMKYVRRMQCGDREAYDLYSRVGASLLPYRAVDTEKTLSPWFRETLPSFGAVAITVTPYIEKLEDKGNIIYPRFLYFRKHKCSPPGVQHSSLGAVYVVTAYFDKISNSKIKHGAPLEYPVVVDPLGGVHVLRTLLLKGQQIRHRRQGLTRGQISQITHQRWGIHKEFIDWAAEHNMSAEELLRRNFIRAANSFTNANASMIRVAASKDKLTALFGIDALRTSYFFKDRDVVLTEKGKKARVFHVRRGHKRITRTGRTIYLRTTFAGLRRFRWNGYDIHISVPDWHHASVIEFTAGAIDETDAEPGVKYSDSAQLAGFFAKHIETGFAAS